MTKVLITEIDQILASSDKRYQLAIDVVMRELHVGSSLAQVVAYLGSDKQTKKLFYSDKAFFNPDFIQFDNLTQNACRLWNCMERVDYTIILTARPNWLQHATGKWLLENFLWNENKMSVICKDYSTRVRWLTNVEWFTIMADVAAQQQFSCVYFVNASQPVLQKVFNIMCASDLEVMQRIIETKEQERKYDYQKQLMDTYRAANTTKMTSEFDITRSR